MHINVQTTDEEQLMSEGATPSDDDIQNTLERELAEESTEEAAGDPYQGSPAEWPPVAEAAQKPALKPFSRRMPNKTKPPETPTRGMHKAAVEEQQGRRRGATPTARRGQ